MVRQQRYPARTQLVQESEAYVERMRRTIERELDFLVFELRDSGMVTVPKSPILVRGQHYAPGG